MPAVGEGLQEQQFWLWPARPPPFFFHPQQQARIHLLMDVAESPRQPLQLRAGQECEFGERIVCPPAAADGAADASTDAADDGDAHGGDGLR